MMAGNEFSRISRFIRLVILLSLLLLTLPLSEEFLFPDPTRATRGDFFGIGSVGDASLLIIVDILGERGGIVFDGGLVKVAGVTSY